MICHFLHPTRIIIVVVVTVVVVVMGKYTQSGDPRRKDLIQRSLVIQRIPLDPEETPEQESQDSLGSYMSLLAVVFGFLAIFFRVWR
jgi:hypothetical protein